MRSCPGIGGGMRRLVLVVAVILSCGMHGGAVPEGHASPDGTTPTEGAPAPPDGTTPASPPSPPAGAPDPAPTPSDAWTLEDVGTTEPCSSDGCTFPTLATDDGGALYFGVHRYAGGPCLICSADRLVRRWDSGAWESVLSGGGWPGTFSTVSFAADPTRDAMLFADPDVVDTRSSPVRLHVWALDAGGATELLPALGDANHAINPVLAVDETGTVTVTWIEAGVYAGTSVVRSARSAGATWDVLPEFPAPHTFEAHDAWMVLDARGAPVVAAWRRVA